MLLCQIVWVSQRTWNIKDDFVLKNKNSAQMVLDYIVYKFKNYYTAVRDKSNFNSTSFLLIETT